MVNKNFAATNRAHKSKRMRLSSDDAPACYFRRERFCRGSSDIRPGHTEDNSYCKPYEKTEHFIICLLFWEAAAERSLDADWESLAWGLRRISTGKLLLFSVRVLYTDVEGLPHSLARSEYIEAVYASLVEKLVRRRMNIVQNDPNITVMTDQMAQPSWYIC